MNIYQKSNIPEHLHQYFEPAELGLEKTPEEFIAKMVQIFSEVKRVLRNDGTLWLNMGDSYAHSLRQSGPEHAGRLANASKGQIKKGFKPIAPGFKEKDLCGIPWMLAFALRADGWYLRSDIIWHKPNPMPESVTDRPTKSHEYMFLLSKSAKYYYDADAIRENFADERMGASGVRCGVPQKHAAAAGRGGDGGLQAFNGSGTGGRNKRTVWTIPTSPMPDAHFATFPKKLIEPCILAGSAEGGTVLDPFFGSGTTGLVAYRHGRKFVGIELSQTYLDDIAIPRIEQERKQLKLF